MRRRLWTWVGVVLALGAAVLVAIGYRNATEAPIVRHLNIAVPNYPPQAAPVRLVLFSDVHVHGPDMPPARVAKIVGQIDELHPDVIVAAGDFIGNNLVGRHYRVRDAVVPLRSLHARLGVYAVLGNNDYRSGQSEVAAELQRAGVHVLRNGAASAGPLAIGGLEGRLYRHDALVRARAETYGAIAALPGIRVLVAHRPDEVVPAPQSIGLVLAGHTHCGQIDLPWIGPLETGSDYGRRFFCGVYRTGSKVLVVTAGVGTSYVPLRFGAPPDVWLITIGGSRPAAEKALRRS